MMHGTLAMNQPAIFPVAIALKRGLLCSRWDDCGKAGGEVEIGPCEPGSGFCQHALFCRRCGKTGTESWNLAIGATQHAREYCRTAPCSDPVVPARVV